MSDALVFQLSEVAEILGISKSTVKNWTIGRPLTIKPSLRAARGTGSSNLYRKGDLLLMALATQLNRDGFTMETVKGVLQEKEVQNEPDLIGTHLLFLVISSQHKGLEIKFLPDKFRKDMYERILRAKHGVFASYVLDLSALSESVTKQVEECMNS